MVKLMSRLRVMAKLSAKPAKQIRSMSARRLTEGSWSGWDQDLFIVDREVIAQIRLGTLPGSGSKRFEDPPMGFRAQGKAEWLVEPGKIPRNGQSIADFKGYIAQLLIRIHGFGMVTDQSSDEVCILLNRGLSTSVDEAASDSAPTVRFLDSNLVDNNNSLKYVFGNIKPVKKTPKIVCRFGLSRRPSSTNEVLMMVNRPSGACSGQLFIPTELWDGLCSLITDELFKEPICSLTLIIRRDGFVPVNHTSESTDIQK